MLAGTITSWGQGTLVYDQQIGVPPEGSVIIQGNQPIGQSFTPALSSIGFIQLEIGDDNSSGAGATVIVDVRSGSITGTILGTSTVTIPAGFNGIVSDSPLIRGPLFYFSTPVSVTPGTTYFFDVNVQAGGDTCSLAEMSSDSYGGGTSFYNGAAFPNNDTWFGEGIVVVPEPSVTWLALAGGGVFLCFRHWKIRPAN